MTRKIIVSSYLVLVFITPLLFFPQSSEIFELPKITFLYVMTILIITLWAIRVVSEGVLNFKRTLLDVPILIFLTSQFVSAVFSIDPLTSLQGYYSRFFGGVLSWVALSLLYWGAVNNLNKKDFKKVVTVIIGTVTLLSLWTIFEKLGFSISCLFVAGSPENTCWGGSALTRPFATFGQPNWLAAYLAMTLPLVWNGVKLKSKNRFIYLVTSLLVFTALLLTKSRAGLLGGLLSFTIFWGWSFLRTGTKVIFKAATLAVLYLALFLFINPLSSHSIRADETVTPSADIRLMLWQGAINIWYKNPIVGTGPETFAYSYYQVRPIAHNLTSEWNFVYSKAHNEYLNFIANTGIIGALTYVGLLLTIAWKTVKANSEISLALFVGVFALAVTNFFGFSVVATGLLMFIYPALTDSNVGVVRVRLLSYIKPFILVGTLLVAGVLLIVTFRFFWADLLFAKGDNISSLKASQLAPHQPQYSEALGGKETLYLSPRNVKLLKNLAQKLMKDNPSEATKVLAHLEHLAPTDPMVPYYQGLLALNSKDYDSALNYFTKALMFKPDYELAQDAMMLIEARN